MLFNLGPQPTPIVFLFGTTSTSSKNQRNHHEAYHRNPTLLVRLPKVRPIHLFTDKPLKSGLFQSCQCRKLGSLLLPRPWSAKLVCDNKGLRRL